MRLSWTPLLFLPATPMDNAAKVAHHIGMAVGESEVDLAPPHYPLEDHDIVTKCSLRADTRGSG